LALSRRLFSKLRDSRRRKYLSQGVAATLSITVLAVILLAPTAAAFTVGVLGLADGQDVAQGGSFKFRVRVTVESGELVPIQQLKIVLDGTGYSFNPNTGAAIPPTTPAISSLTPENFQAGSLYTPTYGYGYGYLIGYGYNPTSGYGYGYGSPNTYGYGFSGPRRLDYLVTLSPGYLSLGPHTLRVDVVTGLSPPSEFSSQTVTFNVVSGTTQSDTVTGTTPSVDHTATTGVSITLSGVTYTDPTAPGVITTLKYTVTPTTAVTISDATGKTAALYIDVKAFNIASGTATITISYTDTEISGLDENTLTLYYYSPTTNTWIELSNIVRDTSANTISGTIDATKLTATILTLAGTPPPTLPPPTIIPKATASLTTQRLTAPPGSSITITLTLTSQTTITGGHITLTLPKYLKISNIKTVNFKGVSTIINRTLRIEKTTPPYTKSATISLTLTIPLNASIQVGETYTITIEKAQIPGATINFATPKTITITITKPTINEIFSALDSHFDKTPSIYTENRIPTIKDILNLLDFHFKGKVQP